VHDLVRVQQDDRKDTPDLGRRRRYPVPVVNNLQVSEYIEAQHFLPFMMNYMNLTVGLPA
jgi:hypothetical protein